MKSFLSFTLFTVVCVCVRARMCVCVCERVCVFGLSMCEMNFLPAGRGSLLTEISLHHPPFNLLSVSVALYSLL